METENKRKKNGLDLFDKTDILKGICVCIFTIGEKKPYHSRVEVSILRFIDLG